MSARRRGLFLAFAALVLTACQEDGPRASGATSVFPNILEEQQRSCERQGGRWGLRAGNSLYVCYLPMSDANQPCDSADDCDGLCLARSRTCSPIKPFLGCHEVLTEAGLPATLCVD